MAGSNSKKVQRRLIDELSFHVDCSRIVSSNFATLRQDRISSDITLKVGTKCYYTHKLVLSNVSLVFRQMFSGNWKESGQKHVILDETEQCKHVFDTFLDFIYGCKNGVLPMSAENVMPLLTLGDKYEVTGLKDLCCTFMETIIEGSVHKAMEWFELAENLQLTSVLEKCYDVICWNLKQAFSLVNDEVLQRITPDQMASILEHEDIIVDTEYDVFAAVDKWVSVSSISAFNFQSNGDEVLESTILPVILLRIEFRNMTSGELEKVKKSVVAKLAWDSTLKKLVEDAYAVRCFETDFFLAAKTKRMYLKNAGTKDVPFQTSTATHFNSATLKCNVPNPESNVPLRCDLIFAYSHGQAEKLYKLVVFQDREKSSYQSYQSRSQGSSGEKKYSYRVIALFLIKNKTSGIIHHVLRCNKFKPVPTFLDGDTLIEFPGISCLDINQFVGHYLGHFDILYKLAVKVYQS